MPILVQKGLPAYNTLKQENVFVMQDARAAKQDIRPLQIAIVNLMPMKEITETQLIRLLANTPIQVELQLLTLSTHDPSHVDPLHMETFYKKFEEIQAEKLDGLIITGAPVETLPFEKVDYWKELKSIMEYSKKNVYSTLHLCWGAQAALYYHFGIDKVMTEDKLFGVFKHKVSDKNSEFTRGFDEDFLVPHSRFARVEKKDIIANKNLKILAESAEAGVHMIVSKGKRQIFLQGHCEYDWDTLKLEYERDVRNGTKINIPQNYFKDDDPTKKVVVKWRGHANLFFQNWINFVYQNTPYDLNQLHELILDK